MGCRIFPPRVPAAGEGIEVGPSRPLCLFKSQTFFFFSSDLVGMRDKLSFPFLGWRWPVSRSRASAGKSFFCGVSVVFFKVRCGLFFPPFLAATEGGLIPFFSFSLGMFFSVATSFLSAALGFLFFFGSTGLGVPAPTPPPSPHFWIGRNPLGARDRLFGGPSSWESN